MEWLKAWLLFAGAIFFLIGYHNVDTAWNMNTINKDTGSQYVDITLSGKIVDAKEAYRTGAAEMFVGFVFLSLQALPPIRLPKKKELPVSEYDNIAL